MTNRFQCYKKNYVNVQKCSCTKYKVYHTVYVNDTVPAQVTYLSGTFTKEEREDHTHGLLAPLYVDRQKQLMLFSHHPEGLVWQVSQKLTTTPLRGVFSGPSCPDTEQITWEWYNVTTPQVSFIIPLIKRRQFKDLFQRVILFFGCRVIFMEDHIPERPDRSQLIGRQTSKWSVLDIYLCIK